MKYHSAANRYLPYVAAFGFVPKRISFFNIMVSPPPPPLLLFSLQPNPTTPPQDNEVALTNTHKPPSYHLPLRRESCPRRSLSCESPLRACSTERARSPSAHRDFQSSIDLDEVPDSYCLQPPEACSREPAYYNNIKIELRFASARARLLPRTKRFSRIHPRSIPPPL
jgi:hypothetical protein